MFPALAGLAAGGGAAAAGGSSLLPALLMAGGGIAGGLLGGSKKSKVKIPYQALTAMTELLKLAKQPLPTLPTENIPGPNRLQTMSGDLLGGYLKGGMGKTYGSAKDRLIAMLDQPQDITERPEYKAIVRTVNKEGAEAVNQVLRRIQKSGMSGSTPQGKAVGREVGSSMENLAGRLAPFAEAERSRQFQGIMNLIGLGQYETEDPARRASIGMGLGGELREIDRQIQNAIFNQKYGQTMLPYTAKAPLYGQILGAPASQPVVTQPSGSTGLSTGLGSASAVARMLPFIFPDQYKGLFA